MAMKHRARQVGIPFPGTPGPLNAITDVPGVSVGHETLVLGQGKLQVGSGPVRTGVTAVFPCGGEMRSLFAAWYSLNGCGEMTGTTWLEESGFLQSPILLTNTFSVGEVATAVSTWGIQRLKRPIWPPVVTETYDGFLNDIQGLHIKENHVWAALDKAAPGPVVEGNVGGGTGLICHGFKGGIGTASRRLPDEEGGFTVGVLVQANHGDRRQLSIAGVPVGELLSDSPIQPVVSGDSQTSSIIVLVATDSPLLPHQLKRLARRVPIGIGIVGGRGKNYSGDIFLAFSTMQIGSRDEHGVSQLKMLANEKMNPLFEAVVEATEEAIVNALVAADTMEGINGYTVPSLPIETLREILRKYGRLVE